MLIYRQLITAYRKGNTMKDWENWYQTYTDAIITDVDIRRLREWFGDGFVENMFAMGHIRKIEKPDIYSMAKHNWPRAVMELRECEMFRKMDLSECKKIVEKIAEMGN